MNKAGLNISVTELDNLPFHRISSYFRAIDKYIEEEKNREAT